MVGRTRSAFPADGGSWWSPMGHGRKCFVAAAGGPGRTASTPPRCPGMSLRGPAHAEFVAAVLCRLYGFDGYLWHSRDYVHHHCGKNPAQAVARVLSDVEKSLALILEAPRGRRRRDSARLTRGQVPLGCDPW